MSGGFFGGLFGNGGQRQEPLLEDDGLGWGYNEEVAAGRRPPPFAPGSQIQGDDYPVTTTRGGTNVSPRVTPWDQYSPRQPQVVYSGRGNAPQTIYVDGSGGQQQQPQVVVIRHEHVGAPAPAPEGVCCALLVFILGFTFPVLWLLACCQMGSPSRSVRFLSRLSMLAFILTATGLGAIIYQDYVKGGKWPWEKECFFPWDPKCKYPPV